MNVLGINFGVLRTLNEYGRQSAIQIAGTAKVRLF